ncbi:MAG: hypothetical protein R3E12_18390 [Candidatus Eisenbacteria bacterium]
MTYSLRITFDGTNAVLDLAADGIHDFTDTLPYEPRAFDHFRMGIDYPESAHLRTEPLLVGCRGRTGQVLRGPGYGCLSAPGWID